MFSRETNQRTGYKSVAAAAIMASCALGAYYDTSNTEQAPEQTIQTNEIEYEEPFEQIVYEKLTEL